MILTDWNLVGLTIFVYWIEWRKKTWEKCFSDKIFLHKYFLAGLWTLTIVMYNAGRKGFAFAIRCNDWLFFLVSQPCSQLEKLFFVDIRKVKRWQRWASFFHFDNIHTAFEILIWWLLIVERVQGLFSLFGIRFI